MPPPGRRYKTTGAKKTPDTSGWTEAEKAKHAEQERLKTPVAEMQLSVRVVNTLEEHDVILAEHLIGQTYESLMRMANFGEKTLTEVRAAVAALGLPVPEWKKPPKPKKLPRPPSPNKFKGLGGIW